MPSSGHFPRVDACAARRRFERAAVTYAAASRLEQEIGDRMLERLDYMRLDPRRILDAASGPGREAAKLQARYRASEVVRADFALPMLRAGHAWLFERKKRVCADLARLPFAAGAFDLVWCNMALHWAEDPLAWLREFARVAAPEGLVLFSTLGPDTLKALRATAGARRVHEFVDMHDLGDMLVACGFSAPVMDMEMVTMAYDGRRTLLDDLKASGQTSARSDRARGLPPRALRALRSRVGNEAQFEVVYGHAWRGAPRKLADGRDIVQFRSAKGRSP
ncbi:MAG TPA: methyltransferase domain-containing protein [Burkholderiales bacterium]|nr:methyltransferase domain-containing protein [Burkholderiales bacterium]